MPASSSTALQPGATYKFVVRSAEEAVQTIRERLGENAKVLSVRQVGGQGLAGLFSRQKLEVIAQVPDLQPTPTPYPPEGDTLALSSAAPSASVGESLADEEALSSKLADYAKARSAAQGFARDVPTRLPELLRKSGFSESALSRLQMLPAFSAQQGQPLHHALVEVGRALRQLVEARPMRPLPARVAFLGTPGVGRTTALCKWLAREVFSQGGRARVLKAEFDRPNPAEGLAVFCEALGVPLEYYAPEESERGVISSSEGALYADLPGISLHSAAENATFQKFLDREQFAGRVLVLNAAYDSVMLRRAYATGRDLGATHLVFTHLDELEHWGKLWDFLLEGELTPLFLATGPSLTGDCEARALDAVLRRTLPGA